MVKLVLLDEGVTTAPHENRLWWTRTVGLVRRHAEQHWFFRKFIVESCVHLGLV